MSLEGEQLRHWVEKQMQEEEERRKQALNDANKQREYEREQREYEREQRELERGHEKEQRQMELELERLRSQNPSGTGNDSIVVTGTAPKGPRLPYFNELKDQVDSYLLRFERFAQVNRWDRNDWATHLSTLLTGKALETYSRLDEQDATNYDKLKEALLKRYNLNEEGFAARFRSSRPEQGESMNQFKTRIMGYLEKWLELAGKDKNEAADVVDLFVKEQIINSCSKELVIFIKERKPKTVDEMIEVAENYITAHGTTGAFSKAPSVLQARPPRDTNHSPPKPRIEQHGKQIICLRCAKPGHIARECRSQKPQISMISSDIRCSYCKRKGHLEKDCWKKEREKSQMKTHGGTSATDQLQCCEHGNTELKCGCIMPVVTSACTEGINQHPKMPVATGYLDGKRVTVLRDSGCSCIVVRKGLVPETKRRDKKATVYLADGRAMTSTMTVAELESPFYNGQVTAVEMDTPLYDVIVGNVPGAKCPGLHAEELMAMETRSAKERKTKPLSVPPTIAGKDINPGDLIKMQNEDENLQTCRQQAKTGEVRCSGKSNKTWYGYEKGILTRYFQADDKNFGDVLKQVVVPTDLRLTVMSVAHESIMAGHLAAKKTTERVLQEFFWPNVWGDIRRYCQSCDQCQRSTPKGWTKKVPLQEVPLIDEPFKRIAVDIVGPILPASERGYRYILTVVDYCTRYPEAIAMKSIDTETVAEALVDIFSRVGIPMEILSDRGTQFTSELMKEICRLLSVRQLTTTPYSPQCNGLVEKFNFTLKSMLKKLAAEKPKEWDRYINSALFAYREAPQESLGFSPFELLYGRSVRGPLTILRELWSNETNDEEIKTTYQYVLDLRKKIEDVISLAHSNLGTSAKRYKKYFDKKTKQRSFKPGEKVLLLIPTQQNKLQVKWQGPFTVIKEVGRSDYTIDSGNGPRTYHINMLKRYHERNAENQQTTCCVEQLQTNDKFDEHPPEIGLLQCAVAAVVEDEEDFIGSEGNAHLEMPALTQTETYRDANINEALSQEQQNEVESIIKDFQDVMTDVPGRTKLYEYDLKLTSSTPIRKKPYPVPQAMKETLLSEVKTMVDAGIIEPSDSPYCSPSVVVKKKDGTNRYCVDYRALNNISVFDAEPMPQLDDLFQQIGPNCRYFSKIDLSKGYWQIPLSAESKPKTAFATDIGLMQFTVLPFGLQCAPAAFSRLMRKVLHGLPNVKNYIDDILLHHDTWEDHLADLKTVLIRLRKAGLTARPSKCYLGQGEVEFLGHRISHGHLAPLTDKIEAIQKATPPQNKKQLRSFMGLASFYRRYVPNFSAITSPLTDCTKKGMPNRIVWEEPQKRAFDHLKRMLTTEPVLRLPDFDKTFIVSTDASDTGIGAILAQEHDDGRYPVVYLSRKLLPREQRFSVVEKECLALVWALNKLNAFLMGREFTVETDHAPLLYLNRAKSENGRLMRWSLLLSQYRFNVRAVKGSDNHGPDLLSRL